MHHHQKRQVSFFGSPASKTWFDMLKQQSLVSRFGPFPCDSHGMYNHFTGSRNVATPQCFNCKKFGHIAKFCHFKRDQCHNGSNRRVHKSEKKRARDVKRLVQFVERKRACVVMPFYDLTAEELQKCAPKCSNASFEKSSERVAALVSSLDCANSAVCDLTVDNAKLREEVVSLNEKVSAITETVAFLEKRLSEANERNKIILEQSDQIEREIVEKVDEVSELRELVDANKRKHNDLTRLIQDTQVQLKDKCNQYKLLKMEMEYLKAHPTYSVNNSSAGGLGSRSVTGYTYQSQLPTANSLQSDQEAQKFQVITDTLEQCLVSCQELDQDTRKANTHYRGRRRRGNFR